LLSEHFFYCNSFLRSDVVHFLGQEEEIGDCVRKCELSKQRPGYHSSLPHLQDIHQPQLTAQVPRLVIREGNTGVATSHSRGTKWGSSASNDGATGQEGMQKARKQNGETSHKIVFSCQ